MNEKKIDYITDPITGLYRRLVPAAVGSLLTATVASLIDTIILSNLLSPIMLSTVSLCMPIYMLLNALALLIVAGGTTIYAVYLGKGDMAEANKFYTVSAWIIVLTGAALMITGLLFTDKIVRLLGANDVLFQATRDYAHVLFFFMIPLMLYTFSLFFVRMDSDPGLTLVATLICAGTNLVLDVLFVGPLGWGVAGAALASCLAYTTALLVNGTHFLKKKNTLHLLSGALCPERISRILRTGAPLSLSQFGMALTTSVFNMHIVRIAGEDHVTAYAIVTQLSMSAMAFYEGIAQAAQPILATNFGSRRHDRIQETFRRGILLECVVTVCCALLYTFGAEVIAGFFSITEGSLVHITTSAIRIFALSVPLTGVNVFMMYYLQAQEDAAGSTLISLLHGTLLLIAALFGMTVLLGNTGIWWSWTAAELLTLPVSGYLFRRCIRIHADKDNNNKKE